MCSNFKEKCHSVKERILIKESDNFVLKNELGDEFHYLLCYDNFESFA